MSFPSYFGSVQIADTLKQTFVVVGTTQGTGNFASWLQVMFAAYDGTSDIAITDDTGHYVLENVTSGPQTLTATSAARTTTVVVVVPYNQTATAPSFIFG